MSQNKYIGTKEAVRLTGLSTQEIYDLIHKGTLQAHKAPKSGWRISTQALADLGLIQQEAGLVIEKPLIEDGVSYVADEEQTVWFLPLHQGKLSSTSRQFSFRITVQ